jgi:hypothetical protein
MIVEETYAQFWSRSRDPDTQAKGKLLQQRLDDLHEYEEALLAWHAAEPDPDERFRIAQDGITGLRITMSDIADEFGLHGMGLFFEPPLHVFQDYNPDGWGRGRRADGAPISSQSRGQGTPATGAYIPGIDLRAKQERGHLVATRLGGLGDEPKHLTPLDKATNTRMRDGPEADAARFIYQGDPSQWIYYIAVAQYRDVGAFQTWLEGYLAPLIAPAVVLPTAGQRLWTVLGTANPTPLEMDVAVGIALTPPQHTRILAALAYYFLCYQVDISIPTVNAAPGNMIAIPQNQSVPHPVPAP